MVSRSFASLAARINPSVPGCGLPLIVQYARTAAILACERSLAWRYEQPAFTLTAGQYRNAYKRPEDTTVHALLHATLNDGALKTLTLEQATDLFPQWARLSTTAQDIADNGSEPRFVTEVSTDEFIVLPAPDAAKTYTMRLIYALKPSRDASEMDASVMDILEEAIVSKALQDLLVLPNVTWSDRELAAYHAKQYLVRMNEYRANANIGRARGTVTARAPRFA